MDAPKKKYQPIPWAVVISIASVISLIALANNYTHRREISGERARLLKERSQLAGAIAEDVGTLRGKIEPWTVALASPQWPGDVVDPDARSLTWRERPVAYLRMRAADATNNDAVHAESQKSSLDGLSSCLLRTKGEGPWAYGEIIARSEHLGPSFVKDVKETPNDLRLRNLAYALDEYKAKEFPIARDGAKLTEYAVIVLDEDPAQIPATSAAFGAEATAEQKILATEHWIRLSVRRLGDGRELLRVRRKPDATLMQVAGDPTSTAAGIEVRKAQAMGCQLANEALELAGKQPGVMLGATPPPLPVVAPTVAPPPSAAPSASASK
ncbi:MAG: hypothetical protein ACXVEF_15150 [Polyangiales bacterium]